MSKFVALLFPLVGACASAQTRATRTPAEVMDQLLAADRQYSATAASSDLITGLTGMFAKDVWMKAPGGFARGVEAAKTALGANPDNAKSHVTWYPIRGGISADGEHGFTYGFMTLTRPDGSTAPGRYLAYWIREEGAWKVAVYNRTPRGAGEAPTAMMPPVLPSKMVAPGSDAPKYAQEVGDAERSFSSESGVIGLGAAFAKYGVPEAMNMGGPSVPTFVFGNDKIAESVSGGDKLSAVQPLTWGPDHVIAASSGDLGVSIGTIEIKGPAGQPPRKVAFFTVWRRSGPGAPWRYIAE